MRGHGWGCESGAAEAWTGDEGAWQCPCFDMAGVTQSKELFCVDKGEGVSEPQCCCRGVEGDGSVGAVQWLWGCV